MVRFDWFLAKTTIKMRKNGKSDQSFKNRFTAERSRQFDLLQSKEVADQNADGCSKRACEFLKPGYQLKPSDGRRLNSSIKEHQSMLGKLKSVVKALPSLKGASTLRKFANCFLIEMPHTLHSSCKETILATPQEAKLSQTSSRRLEITCTASCTLKSML